MRRALALPILVLALTLAPGAAHAFGIGIGAFGGGSFPISQEDVKSGATFGVRIPISTIPLVSAEPYFAKSTLGDGETTSGGTTTTVDGFDNTSFGVNAFLGSLAAAPGIKFFPYVGIASTKLTRNGFSDIKKASYNFGLGAGLGLVKSLSVDGRAEMNVIDTGDKTRKFGNVTIGLSYQLFHKL
ncbi:MAG TPA: outer membrane beta-barrel protein [Candidatus Eisenbacteria bacterium]|nr:outer membrane beta-barrel protein [Candidatus Eisenbacteria bacterium]